MDGFILPPMFKIVSKRSYDLDAKIPLLLNIVILTDYRIIHKSAIFGNGPHEFDLPGAEGVKYSLDLGCLHTGFEVIQEWVVHVVLGSEKVDVVPPLFDLLLEVGLED